MKHNAYDDLELVDDFGLPPRMAEALPPKHGPLHTTLVEIGHTSVDAFNELRKHKLLSASIGSVALGAGLGVQALRTR